MVFGSGFVWLLVTPVIFIILLALYLWSKGPWLVQWLRGTSGFLLMGVAVIGVFLLFDLASYRALSEEKPLTTVSIEKMAKQEFTVVMTMPDGEQRSFVLFGDQWQLDVRLLVWHRQLLALGVESLYRLDRIAGRYMSLEQEREAKRSVYSLENSKGIDLWQLAKKYQFGVDAQFGSAVYMPLQDGALFSVYQTARGLTARPMNTIAEQSLDNPW